MSTAREVIGVSLRDVGIATKYKEASDEDYNDCLRFLNGMLAMWYKLGLRQAINTNTIDNLSDLVPYPEYAMRAIEKNLTINIWSHFKLDSMINPFLANEAAVLKNELWSVGAPNPSSIFPGTLPIGSGNEHYNTGYTTPFYPAFDDNIYAGVDNALTNSANVILTGVNNDE